MVVQRQRRCGPRNQGGGSVCRLLEGAGAGASEDDGVGLGESASQPASSSKIRGSSRKVNVYSSKPGLALKHPIGVM